MINEFLNVSSREVPLASLPGICVFEGRQEKKRKEVQNTSLLKNQPFKEVQAI